jgi:golgi to ER traffic protein 4
MGSTRYIRIQDYDSAIQLLYLGGELLLENGLGASGADITTALIDVYNTAHMKPDSTNRGKSPARVRVEY